MELVETKKSFYLEWIDYHDSKGTGWAKTWYRKTDVLKALQHYGLKENTIPPLDSEWNIWSTVAEVIPDIVIPYKVERR